MLTAQEDLAAIMNILVVALSAIFLLRAQVIRAVSPSSSNGLGFTIVSLPEPDTRDIFAMPGSFEELPARAGKNDRIYHAHHPVARFDFVLNEELRRALIDATRSMLEGFGYGNLELTRRYHLDLASKGQYVPVPMEKDLPTLTERFGPLGLRLIRKLSRPPSKVAENQWNLNGKQMVLLNKVQTQLRRLSIEREDLQQPIDTLLDHKDAPESAILRSKLDQALRKAYRQIRISSLWKINQKEIPQFTKIVHKALTEVKEDQKAHASYLKNPEAFEENWKLVFPFLDDPGLDMVHSLLHT